MKWTDLDNQRQDELLRKLVSEPWIRVAGMPTNHELSTWHAFVVSFCDTSVFFQGASNIVSTRVNSPMYNVEMFTIKIFEIDFADWKNRNEDKKIEMWSIIDLTNKINDVAPKFLGTFKSIQGFAYEGFSDVEIKSNNHRLTGVSALGFASNKDSKKSPIFSIRASNQTPGDTCVAIGAEESIELLSGLHLVERSAL